MEYLLFLVILFLLAFILSLSFARKRGEPKKELETEYVYLLTDATGLYKIGRTNNLTRRVTGRTRTLSLRIVGYIPTRNSRGLEKKIHGELDKYRIPKSEWFEMDLKDRRWIYWFEMFHKVTNQKVLDEINQGAWIER